MPDYLARVVLHRLNTKGNDSAEDYSDLHTELEKHGFEPVISGKKPASTDSKTHYALPGGMYYFDNDRPINKDKTYSLEQAMDLVDAAVAEVLKDESKYIQDANNPHSIFVMEAGQAGWTGLKPAPMRGIKVAAKKNPFTQ